MLGLRHESIQRLSMNSLLSRVNNLLIYVASRKIGIVFLLEKKIKSKKSPFWFPVND